MDNKQELDDQYQEYVNGIADESYKALISYSDVCVDIESKHGGLPTSESISVETVMDDVMGDELTQDLVQRLIMGEKGIAEKLRAIYQKHAQNNVDIYIKGGR